MYYIEVEQDKLKNNLILIYAGMVCLVEEEKYDR